jgi:hypothetical protein
VKHVSGGGEENARAPGLAPDTLIGAASLRPVVVTWIELLLVDPQFSVQEIQLLDSPMAVRRIVGSRRETHE